MSAMAWIGRLLVIAGLLSAGVGVLFIIASRIPFLGRLPGDILIQRKNVTLYFPLMTSLVISLLAALVIRLWQKR